MAETTGFPAGHPRDGAREEAATGTLHKVGALQVMVAGTLRRTGTLPKDGTFRMGGSPTSHSTRQTTVISATGTPTATRPAQATLANLATHPAIPMRGAIRTAPTRETRGMRANMRAVTRNATPTLLGMSLGYILPLWRGPWKQRDECLTLDSALRCSEPPFVSGKLTLDCQSDTPCPDDPDEPCPPPCDEEAWCNQPDDGDYGDDGECDPNVTCDTPCPDDPDEPCYPPCDDTAWCNQEDNGEEGCDEEDGCGEGGYDEDSSNAVKFASLAAIPPAPASEAAQTAPVPAASSEAGPPIPIPSLPALTTLVTSLVGNSSASLPALEPAETLDPVRVV